MHIKAPICGALFLEDVVKRSTIARVTPVTADKYLFVEIETADGRIGVGESGAWAHIEATRTVIEKFAEYLVGRDAEEIEKHWQILCRFGSYAGSLVMGALSAVDVALWDLKGQRLAEPIYALLGGPYRQKMRVYGHARGATRKQLVERSTLLKAAGFNAVGHVNPFLDEDVDKPVSGTFASRLRFAVETLEEVRSAIGPDTDLCIEIHRRLRPAEAIALGDSISHIMPLFYEDPIRPDSASAMCMVQNQLKIPIATGERLFTLQQFHQLLESGGARYLRPCLSLCGGFTGARKVAALAEVYDVDLIPHNTYSPIATVASMHLAASIPNLLILEYPTARYTDDIASTGLVAQELAVRSPVQEGGYVTVEDRPGLGTSLVKGVAEAFPYRPIPIYTRLNIDGSPTEH
nr:mandelate racemase/muconate lactonizing enzyme family protein [Rhizobium sp. P38BS-XIX]